MTYDELGDGIYLLRRRSVGVLIEHEAILVVGEPCRQLWPDGPRTRIVHQTPPRLRTDSPEEFGDCLLLGRVDDQVGAIARIRYAHTRPDYDPLFRNCEHFARFVVNGQPVSPQLWIAGVAIGAAWLVAKMTASARKAA